MDISWCYFAARWDYWSIYWKSLSRRDLLWAVFYEDNTSKKRWVLEFDYFESLGSIDAVFVTAEPNLGTHQPSRQQSLFAYRGGAPNHP